MQTLWISHLDANTTAVVDPVAVLGDLAKDALALVTPEQQLLAATMLTVPNENYLFEQLRGFEVDTLLDARDLAVQGAALRRTDTWAALVELHDTGETYRADAKGIARRALGNVAFFHVG